MTGVVYTIVTTGFAIVLFFSLKNGRFIKTTLSNALSGILSMIAVNVVGLLTGVTISLNWYTIAFTAMFGIPGTITFVILNCCFLL